MSLTFLNLQDAVKADRFNENQRADIKNWINHRYAWLWASEDWTFKQATSAVTLTAGSRTVTDVPASFETAKALFLSDGSQLEHLDPVRFYAAYQGDTSTGTPCHYTIVNGTISVGPTPNVTSASALLVYTAGVTMLSADSDIPAIPAGFHFLLVDGAAALGLKLQNDPTWQSFDQEWLSGIETMQGQYLRDDASLGRQWGDPAEWPL